MRWLFVLVFGASVLVGCDKACESPQARADGLEECESGLVARSQAETCESALPRPDFFCQADPETAGCSADSDCTEAPLGICNQEVNGVGFSCGCGYGCSSDDDCGSGAACLCGAAVGYCAPADCRSNADCADGQVCALWETSGNGCYRSVALACTSDDDACRTEADCPTGELCIRRNGQSACSTQVECQ